MRRSLPTRLFAAFFAPWFALVVAEPVPMHECPEHSLHPAASHAVLAAALAQADAHGEHSMPQGDMEQMGATHGHRSSSHTSHRYCCCLGACSAAAVAALTTPPRLAWLPLEIRRIASHLSAGSFSPASAEHALPFANGPPAARI
jgi:hypothetical protein